jgi:hypothetical protein
MGDALVVERGAQPWLPSADATIKSVLHRFDIPLAGVIEQHGHDYLFWCVTGHAAPENAWAYAQVNDADIERLTAATSADFDEILRDVVGDNACTFAVASSYQGVIASVVLSPPATFDDVHQRGMAVLAERFQEMFAEYNALQESFPLLRSAANFPLRPSPRATEPASVAV